MSNEQISSLQSQLDHFCFHESFPNFISFQSEKLKCFFFFKYIDQRKVGSITYKVVCYWEAEGLWLLSKLCLIVHFSARLFEHSKHSYCISSISIKAPCVCMCTHHTVPLSTIILWRSIALFIVQQTDT